MPGARVNWCAAGAERARNEERGLRGATGEFGFTTIRVESVAVVWFWGISRMGMEHTEIAHRTSSDDFHSFARFNAGSFSLIAQVGQPLTLGTRRMALDQFYSGVTRVAIIASFTLDWHLSKAIGEYLLNILQR